MIFEVSHYIHYIVYFTCYLIILYKCWNILFKDISVFKVKMGILALVKIPDKSYLKSP